MVYGNIELWNDLEIPINDIPTILQGTALTIPKEITLINNGAVIPENGFNITVLGTLSRNKTNGANER